MGKVVYERNQEQVEEKPKIDFALLKRKGSYKTCSGIMLADMQKFRKDGNFAMAQYCQEKYKQMLEVEKKKSSPLVEIEVVEGWKGIDNIEIFRGFTEDFVIKSHQKDKETGEISEQVHTIPHENVNRIFFWIKKWQKGETHKCYDFATFLGFEDWKSLWKERKKYFELYYFPVKVLEALAIINYSGRGDVTRIK